MDWTQPFSTLFPPVQAAALHALWRRTTPLTGSDVHRASSTGSYRGTAAALDRLVTQGLVEARQVGRAWEYRINEDHLVYPALTAAFEAFAPRADLDDRLRTLVREHHPEGEPSLAYFGSFARGEARSNSDIDLLLVLPDDTTDDAGDRLVNDLETQGRRWTGNEIQVYVARVTDLRRAVEQEDPIVENWRRDAISIVGPSILQLLETIP